MKIEFDAEQHIYTVDGVIVPSVTEIIKPLTIETFETANAVLKNMAAERGTRIHEATVLFDYLGRGYDYDTDIIRYLNAYESFIRDYGIKGYVLTEGILSNGEYAGTIDRLAYIDGRYTVIDLKTGTTSNPRAFAAQLYGYAKLLADHGRYGTEFDGMIVKLKKDGTYSAVQYDLKNRGKQLFEQCWTLWETIKEDKEKYGRNKRK